MNSGRRERVKALLTQAAQLEQPRRQVFIENAAGDDPEVAAEAIDLLQTLDDSVFLCAPTVTGAEASPTTPPGHEDIGASIGRYKLLNEIGEGGFGTVFMAEQTEPVVRRVALKVIKAGMDTRQVIARFEAERQALALMDHPHIAKVLDAGTTAQGQPYFVMELVRGDPITKYCDREQLTVEQRLDLFRDVCQAVQHAHQKGIIHRDIKPNNVLVTVADGRALAKVIDFGIAKATATRLTDKTLFTELHQLMGTPEYMSPEQVETSGEDIDTRSDVYSLGVLLYELLTGTTPFDFRRGVGSGLDGVVRVIREKEPPRPSLRLRTLTSSGRIRSETPASAGDATADSSALEIARRRRSQPLLLMRALRGDLDWIVMKCLEKDRRRRYETANALAQDIKRYLANEPVTATPPTGGYRIRKFVLRNRGVVVAMAAVGVTLIAGLTGTSLAWMRALAESARATNEAQHARLAETEQRRLAEAEAAARAEAETRRTAEERARQKFEAISEFVTNVLKSSDPGQGGMQRLLVIDAMDQAIGRLDAGELQDQPETEAALRLTLARIINSHGRPEQALQLARRALEITLGLHAGDDPDVATSLKEVAYYLHWMGSIVEALPMYVSALEMSQRLSPDDHPAVAEGHYKVAGCLQSLGRSAEALQHFQASLEMRRRLYAGDHPDIAANLSAVFFCLRDLNLTAEALPKLEAALEMQRRMYGSDHPDIARTLHNHAVCLQSLGRPADALQSAEAALEMRRRIFSGDHPAIAESLNGVARCLVSLDRPAEALPKSESALAMLQRLVPGDRPDVALCLHDTASCLDRLDRRADALLKYEQALEMYQRIYPSDHPAVASCLRKVGLCLNGLGRPAEALAMLEAAQAMHQRLTPGDNPGSARGLLGLGTCLRALGRLADALRAFEAALAMGQRVFSTDHAFVAESKLGIADCLEALGRSEDAMHAYETALEMYRSALSADDPRTLVAQVGLARTLAALGRHAQAEPFLLDAGAQCERCAASRRLHGRVVLETAVLLYEGWHLFDPAQGHDARAAAWRVKLARWPAPTNPGAP